MKTPVEKVHKRSTTSGTGPAQAPPVAPSRQGILASRCEGGASRAEPVGGARPEPVGGSRSEGAAPEGGAPSRSDAGDRPGARFSGEAAASSSSPVNFGAWGAEPEGGAAAPAPEVGAPAQGSGLLRRGARGDQVRALQESLRARGAPIEADGDFGPATQRAVRQFQKKHGLGVDGIAGPETMKALARAAERRPSGGEGAVKPPGEGAVKPSGEGAAPDRPAGESAGTDGKPPREGRFAHTREALDRLPAGLRPYAEAFQKAGERYGVDPRFLAAISVQETGGGRSAAFRRRNNAMGISGTGGPKRFSSVEASINSMARTLANPEGYYRGRNTISGIASVYAPIGAANDPNGLNNHWQKGVKKFYRMLGGDPSDQVVFR